MHINKRWAIWIQKFWYEEMYLSAALMPLSMLYVDVMRFRRFCYRWGFFKSHRLPVPVIIVGNISVGGTGKTPLVIYLAQLLQQHGWRPGIISRGYQGDANHAPQAVSASSHPAEVGDEAVLLAQHSGCPVVVCADRVAAGRFLLAQSDCNLLICDDGLQHYALQRDIEIAVIDGSRRLGNGYCLPIGPLREPPERLREVDLVVVNGDGQREEGEWLMHCQSGDCVNLLSGERRPVSAFAGQKVHALAAIGNPQRFFRQLQQAGLQLITHAFPDHYAFTPEDIAYKTADAILMTEKDAVKCRAFAQARHWYLPIQAELDSGFTKQLLTLLARKTHHG